MVFGRLTAPFGAGSAAFGRSPVSSAGPTFPVAATPHFAGRTEPVGGATVDFHCATLSFANVAASAFGAATPFAASTASFLLRVKVYACQPKSLGRRIRSMNKRDRSRNNMLTTVTPAR